LLGERLAEDQQRDFIGYGRRPPHPRWPGDARLALNFVVNYEEGAEYSLVNGDDRPETILSEVGAAPAVLGTRDLNMESMYDYGARAGVWRVFRAFAELGVTPTIYVVGLALERNPQIAEAIAEMGADVVAHGWRWIDYAPVPESQEREHIQRCIEVIARLTGKRPLGWYTGRPSLNTRRLVVEEGGFLYDGDAYADDLPFWTKVGGKDHLIIPHSFDHNDSRMARNQDLAIGDDFFHYLRDAFDILYREGTEAPKMMTVSLHCRLIGRPGRTGGLRRFIDHVRAHDRVWICRREEIARHWIATHPPVRG
jgi:putative urate catabolism protein